MSCDDIADCIETSEAVQAAIAAQIASNPVIDDQIGQKATQGVYLSPAEMAAPLTKAPGCDPDILFGSITAIVDQFNTNNEDFLEMMEARTNIIERVSLLIGAIPIFETLPADEIVEFVNKLFEDVVENYKGQYTTALKDEYRCDLFCLAQDTPECELTFDMIVQYFENRLGASFEDEQLFVDLVTFFVTGTWTGTRVADIMHLIQVGIWRVASSWIGIRLRTLQTVGLLGANDPDPDWSILCDDCIPPDPDCIDLGETPERWTSNVGPGAFGIWHEGSGWGPGTGGDGKDFSLGRAVLGEDKPAILTMKFYFSTPITNPVIYGTGGGSWVGTGPYSVIELDETNAPTLFPFSQDTNVLNITTSNNQYVVGGRFTQWCFTTE